MRDREVNDTAHSWWKYCAYTVIFLAIFHLLIESVSKERNVWYLLVSTERYFVLGAIILLALPALFRGKVVLNQNHDDEGVERAGFLSSLSWQELILILGEHFRRQGFRVLGVSDHPSDDGIDFVLLRDGATLLVQCKCWQEFQVSERYVSELHDLVKTRDASGGFLVTSGVFAKNSAAIADTGNITLIDGFELYKIMKDVRHTIEHNTRQLIGSAALIPECPRCGKRMVLRVNRSGNDDDRLFWGCVNQPACIEMRDF